MTFYANGTASYARTVAATMSYPWSVTGNQIRMGDESKGAMLWVKQKIYPWLYRHILGKHYAVGVATEYQILSIEPDKIRLRASGGEVVYTRVPQ